MPGLKTMLSGQGTGSGSWSPTITYMLVLVVAEMVVFHIIGRVLG